MTLLGLRQVGRLTRLVTRDVCLCGAAVGGAFDFVIGVSTLIFIIQLAPGDYLDEAESQDFARTD